MGVLEGVFVSQIMCLALRSEVVGLIMTWRLQSMYLNANVILCRIDSPAIRQSIVQYLVYIKEGTMLCGSGLAYPLRGSEMT